MLLPVMFVMGPAFHQCSRLATVLEAHRCSTRVVASLSQYAVTTKETRPAAIVVEVPGPDPDEQLASVAQLHAGGMHPPGFVLACRGAERLCTAAVRARATDYFIATF